MNDERAAFIVRLRKERIQYFIGSVCLALLIPIGSYVYALSTHGIGYDYSSSVVFAVLICIPLLLGIVNYFNSKVQYALSTDISDAHQHFEYFQNKVFSSLISDLVREYQIFDFKDRAASYGYWVSQKNHGDVAFGYIEFFKEVLGSNNYVKEYLFEGMAYVCSVPLSLGNRQFSSPVGTSELYASSSTLTSYGDEPSLLSALKECMQILDPTEENPASVVLIQGQKVIFLIPTSKNLLCMEPSRIFADEAAMAFDEVQQSILQYDRRLDAVEKVFFEGLAKRGVGGVKVNQPNERYAFVFSNQDPSIERNMTSSQRSQQYHANANPDFIEISSAPGGGKKLIFCLLLLCGVLFFAYG